MAEPEKKPAEAAPAPKKEAPAPAESAPAPAAPGGKGPLIIALSCLLVMPVAGWGIAYFVLKPHPKTAASEKTAINLLTIRSYNLLV